MCVCGGVCLCITIINEGLVLSPEVSSNVSIRFFFEISIIIMFV